MYLSQWLLTFICQASLLPAPTVTEPHQNTAATPSHAPRLPNSKGMATLDALISINLRPKPSPWRSGGNSWCKLLITMGCTLPKASPSNADIMPMAQAECANG